MTQLQARNIFNEIHAPCCAYHYAEEAVRRPDEDPEPIDPTSLTDRMDNILSDVAASVQHQEDKTDSIQKLYGLVALALRTIDCVEGRLADEG